MQTKPYGDYGISADISKVAESADLPVRIATYQYIHSADLTGSAGYMCTPLPVRSADVGRVREEQTENNRKTIVKQS